MKSKVFGVTGSEGKIGSLLLQWADFVPVECDVTNRNTMPVIPDLDVLINCAAISSIDKCEVDDRKCIQVNMYGLHNLHKSYGKRILNLSSEQVFPDRLFPQKEDAVPHPLNRYGFSKWGAEEVSKRLEGKTLRLSRTVSIHDPDIANYLDLVKNDTTIQVPVFMFRSYSHRKHAARAIEKFVRNYDAMPSILNFGGERVSYFTLVKSLVRALKLDTRLVKPRFVDVGEFTPRPFLSGLNTNKAKRFLHIPTLDEVVGELKKEHENA